MPPQPHTRILPPEGDSNTYPRAERWKVQWLTTASSGRLPTRREGNGIEGGRAHPTPSLLPRLPLESHSSHRYILEGLTQVNSAQSDSKPGFSDCPRWPVTQTIRGMWDVTVAGLFFSADPSPQTSVSSCLLGTDRQPHTCVSLCLLSVRRTRTSYLCSTLHDLFQSLLS